MLGLGNILTKGGAVLGFPNKYSFNFDGNGDYLDCGASNVLVTGTNVTLSCWFKVDGTSRGYLIQNQKGVGSTNLTIQVNSNDSSETAGYVGAIIWRGTGHDFISFDGDVDDGAWHHLALTTTSSAQVLYLDGTSVATGSTTFTNASSTDSTLIGNDGGSNYDFDGLIDEVAIWDTALSASDVAKIASKPVDLSKPSKYATDRTANLKLWLRAGDKAEPESTTAIARQDFYTDFDGTDDYVDTGTTIGTSLGDNYAGSLTTCFWFKADVTNGDDGLFYIGNFTGSEGEWSVSIIGNRLDWKLNNNGWKIRIDPFTSTDWNHLACVYSAGSESNSKMYLNGESVGTASGTFPSASDIDLNGLKTILGAYYSSTYPLDGAISNVSVYQTALDAQTISQMAKSRFIPVRDNRFSVVDFDGSNDHINIDGLSFSGDKGTFAFWVNSTQVSSVKHLIDIADADGGNDVQLSFQANAGNQLGIRIGASYTRYGSFSNHNDGNWHHIVFVLDGTSGTIYVDGVSETKTIPSSLNIVNATKAKIASDNAGTNRFYDGALSSVSIYNVAKSAEEVYAIYQQGITYDESSLSGLQGYWRMGDDTSKAFPTIADSSSNSNDGTITNGASEDIVQQMVAGYDLGAFESSSEELGGEFITSNTASDWTDFVSNGTEPVKTNTANGVSLKSQGDSRAAYYTISGLTNGSLYKVVFNSRTDIVDGNVKIYFNASTTYFSPAISTTDTQYTIYGIAGSSNSLNIFALDTGTTIFIENFSIKEVLQSEVSDTYPAIIDVNEPVLGVEVASNNFGGWTLNGWTDNGDETASANNSSGGNQDLTISYSFTASTFYKITATFSNISGNFYFSMDGTGGLDKTITTNGEQILYVKTASGGASSFFIRSSNGSSATISNVSIRSVEGNVGTMTNQDSADLVYSSVLPDQSFLGTGVNSAYNFLDFDGTDAYVASGTSNIPSGDVSRSISAWLNADVLSGDQAIVYTGTRSTNQSFAIAFLSANANKISVWGTSNDFTGTTTISTGTWYHVVAVYDSSASNLKTYINGTLDIDTTVSTNFNTTIGNNIIGSGKFSGGAYTNFFNGKIAQPAIWNNRTLSSTEVSAIYTAGRHSNLLDSYSDNLVSYHAFGALDSKTGLADTDSTIYDRSGNSNHGTTSGTATGDLKSPPNAEPNGYAKGDTNRSTTTP